MEANKALLYAAEVSDPQDSCGRVLCGASRVRRASGVEALEGYDHV